jgi:hypothetical protein
VSAIRLVLACLAFATAARAHDPYESWASASVHPERMTLIVTMAQATALKIIDPELKEGAITEQNFATLKPRLMRAATALFVLTSARKPLVAQKAEVELTEENDIIFTLAYPRPAPGPLRFRAAFLEKLGQGYGGILEVLDGANKDLGWEKLSFENPSFEVKVP